MQMQMVYAIFQESGVVQSLGIKESLLAHFIANVATNYHANPYHNLVRTPQHSSARCFPPRNPTLPLRPWLAVLKAHP